MIEYINCNLFVEAFNVSFRNIPIPVWKEALYAKSKSLPASKFHHKFNGCFQVVAILATECLCKYLRCPYNLEEVIIQGPFVI